jgi:CubicO group peptidase (beta-lactamase class C family)
VPAPHIDGEVADRFAPVREVFAANLQRGEVGASLCVWHRGEVVVDLWGGLKDRDGDQRWERDTLATVFSATKGVVALALLMLADRGELDYDAPVAAYWPEFAEGGKAEITVRTLLNHRAGLIGVDDPLTLQMFEDAGDRIAEILAAQAPRWSPGSDQGYHGVTYGLYTAELFRRIAGRSLGEFIAAEIAVPLGAEFYLGLPPELEPRVAVNYPASVADLMFKIVPKLLFHSGTDGRVYRNAVRRGDTADAFANPAELGARHIENFNTERVHRLELPWGNGIGTARGLCRIYAALAAGGTLDGARLVSPAALDPLRPRQSWSERDRVLCKPIGWSQGFLKEETRLFSPNPESFGHAGAGGALGWCDPIAGLAIGYAKNKMDHRVRSRRAVRVCHAIYECLT